jgi:pimeloyl-ACP methyl ester carboxylesterase
MVYLGQGRLIYFPRNYAANTPALEKVKAHSYVSGDSKQWVYVLKREESNPPDRVWWVFGGNGATALGWVELVAKSDSAVNQAFVLFEYPGYGFNSGRPGPGAIFQSVDDAITVVSESLGLSHEELLSRSQSAGHSLGCAVALDMANRHGLERVIAISPFTTMQAMADRSVGVFSKLLSHRYDNEASIDALLDRKGEVAVTIFHGEQDTLIPLEMGRSLAERDSSGESVEFIPVSGAGHNDIIWSLEDELLVLFDGE